MSTLHMPVSADDHVAGNPKAPIVLVEYGDYQCPACGAAYPLVQQIQQKFGDDVCLVFRNFPLVDMHPQAQSAAVVAEFAAKHGKFWEAHDALYENQRSLGESFYVELVNSLGLSSDDLKQAMQTDAFEQRIRRDIDSGLRSGVNGTPTFYVNGERFDTPGGFNDLPQVLEEMLRPTR
ncbi:DsbA family protein [Diaphorobacter aerolatus]|uniref:Thioredoxin domain-containing protein n=1 Tax=Diaphorobacter aerolatus TaxID=1288495 RepID=A0A7H0GFX4_9BURK|nr:thioredoxin domain-containing protein [Diaphorobacter aerolatus]QNP47190.1 thioredoxin domain-containing protein [Diaphorobacter aerolatus]